MTVSSIKSSRWVALVLVVLAGLAMGIGAMEQPQSSTTSLPDGTDSKFVAEVLEQRPGDDVQTAIALLDSATGKVLDLGKLQGLAMDLGGPLIPNDDSTAAIIPFEVPDEGAQEGAQRVFDVRTELAANAPEGVETFVTGPAAVSADLVDVFPGRTFSC